MVGRNHDDRLRILFQSPDCRIGIGSNAGAALDNPSQLFSAIPSVVMKIFAHNPAEVNIRRAA
jgi:hypothetical protein